MEIENAIERGEETTLRELLHDHFKGSGAHLPPDALLIAMQSQESAAEVAILLLLLESGADPNRLGTRGSRPLHVAALNDFVVYTRLPLSHGANSIAKDIEEDTALHTAARKSSSRIVGVIVRKDSNFAGCVAKKNGQGNTALHLAAAAGRLAIVEVLVPHVLFIDSRNEQGETALMRAAGKGHQPIVRFLIKNQADPADVDGAGKRAVDHARESGNRQFWGWLAN